MRSNVDHIFAIVGYLRENGNMMGEYVSYL